MSGDIVQQSKELQQSDDQTGCKKANTLATLSNPLYLDNDWKNNITSTSSQNEFSFTGRLWSSLWTYCLICIGGSQLRWFGHQINMSPGGFIDPTCPWNSSGWEEGSVGYSSELAATATLSLKSSRKLLTLLWCKTESECTQNVRVMR